MLHPEEITGVVLAGGKSSRFGSNKALSRFRNESFLQHIAELARPYTKEVVIAGFYDEYQEMGMPVLKDRLPGIGALGGIYTALTYSSTPWILVMTCDMPLLTKEVIMHMMAVGRGEHVIGWKYTDNIGIFPLLLSKAIIPRLEEAIGKEQYRVKQLFEWGKCNLTTIPEDWRNLFVNINTPEDYKNSIE